MGIRNNMDKSAIPSLFVNYLYLDTAFGAIRTYI